MLSQTQNRQAYVVHYTMPFSCILLTIWTPMWVPYTSFFSATEFESVFISYSPMSSVF